MSTGYEPPGDNGHIVTRFGLAGLCNAKTAGLGRVDADSAQGSEGGWGLEQAPTHSECGLEALRALQSHSPVLWRKGSPQAGFPATPGPGLKVQSSGGLADVEFFRRH